MNEVSVVFFNQQFRLHDNPSLHKASLKGLPIIPVVTIHPDYFEPYPTPFAKHENAGQFHIASIKDLEKNLSAAGGLLYCHFGTMLESIQNIQKYITVKEVYIPYQLHPLEHNMQKAVSEWGIQHNINVHITWQHTLVDQALLGPQTNTPDRFFPFKKKVEKRQAFGLECDVVSNIQFLEHSFQTLDTSLSVNNIRFNTISPIFLGGESHGLNHMNQYIHKSQRIHTYKQDRNGLIGTKVPSHLSPWIANGCLSPRTIYNNIQNLVSKTFVSASTNMFIMELLWRDFFQFQCRKYYHRWNDRKGIQQKETYYSHDQTKLTACVNGNTNNTFINANMKELRINGYISNRGRQNVASYFVHELQGNWLVGASIFAYYLIDFDFASNHGNWMTIAGVGNASSAKVFDIDWQQKQYDPDMHYINFWDNKLVRELEAI